MNCEKYLLLIDDLIENELAATSAAQTNAHVFACAGCRARYESLKREKEIYAHFLFDVEPPQNLAANFQTRLAAEKEKTSGVAQTPTATAAKAGFFAFLRFYPAFAAAILLIFGIGFVWLKFAPVDSGGEQFAAAPNTDFPQIPSKNGADEKRETEFRQTGIENVENKDQTKFEKSGGKLEVVKTRRAAFPVVKKPIAVQAVKIKQKTVSERSQRNALAAKLPDEAERRKLLTANLEDEIAGQIEKIELLLRSFRNARETENVETFDVQHEKRQARALLEKNARLRVDAENFGVFYAEEMLSRAEPYLLDIANLANKPEREQVLDIKERVRNQNIIASLQIY